MFIPISLALLALSAGMFLLAKTNKEDLGKSFKVISYFIIICSFLVMALTVVCGFTRMILHKARGHKHERRFHPGMYRMHRPFFHHGGGYGRMERWNDEEDGRGPEYENEHHRFGYGYEGQERFSNRWEGMESNPEERLERMTRHLSEKMNLNADQTHKLQEILKASMQKENEIRTQTNGNREEFKKLSRENWQNRSEAIKKILTPEQLKLYNEREESRNQDHEKKDS